MEWWLIGAVVFGAGSMVAVWWLSGHPGKR